MGKKKSVVYFVLITIVLAALCVWCTLSFGAGVKKYHSVINIIQKDTTLGGSYSLTYYPEGVISAEDFQDNCSAYENDAEGLAKYTAKYVAYGTGAIYLEKDEVLDAAGNVSEEFKNAFSSDVKALGERFEACEIEGARVDVANDYTVRVTLPRTLDDPSSYYTYFSYTGALTMAYNETKIAGEKQDEPIGDYVTDVYSTTADGTAYVVIDFTEKGRELVKTKTESAASSSSQTSQQSSNVLYFYVGDNAVINLTVSEQIDQASLYISGNYTADSAAAVATLMKNALTGTQTDLELTAGSVQSIESINGDNTMLFVYIGLGAFLLLTAVFFIVRYHGLGLVHLYGYLTYAVAMALCLAFIPFLHLGVGGVVAILASSALLCVSNLIAFEYAKKEYLLGKTMTSSVKTGYKKCFWRLFDLHIGLALAAVLTFAIALTELQVFAFIFLLGVLFSGVCTLGLTRFYWAITMALAKKKDKFCNFKRGEVEDDD